MNIFASSNDPIESAVALDDKRLIKMVLETAQLLSTAVRMLDGDELADRYGLYKKTHPNHPCSVWTRDNVHNYVWLAQHGIALAREYQRRYDKRHASLRVIQACDAIWGFGTFPIGPTDLAFPNCARNGTLGLDFTSLPVHEAYRAYLSARWFLDRRTPTWTQSAPPEWSKLSWVSSLDSSSAQQAGTISAIS